MLGSVPSAEGKHDSCTLPRPAGHERQRQRRVDHAAGNPAPRQSGEQRLSPGTRWIDAPRQRADQPPQSETKRLESLQPCSAAEQRRTDREQHQRSEDQQHDLHRQHVGGIERSTERADQRTGERVTRDATGVITGGKSRRGHVARPVDLQCADEAAAHASAVQPAQQGQYEGSKRLSGQQIQHDNHCALPPASQRGATNCTPTYARSPPRRARGPGGVPCS